MPPDTAAWTPQEPPPGVPLPSAVHTTGFRRNRYVILRHATDDDAGALTFNAGDASVRWLAEEAEIVAGLVGRRSDPSATDDDRRVVINAPNDELVAVLWHTSASYVPTADPCLTIDTPR